MKPFVKFSKAFTRDKNPIVVMEKPFVDARGTIQPLVEDDMKSALLITSKKGSIRANHYHITDWHYCYMISGAMEYYHRETGTDDAPECIVVREGQTVFTPPMVDHAMRFTEDSVFLTLSRNSRKAQNYEADTKRVNLIDGDSQEQSIRRNLKHRTSCRLCESAKIERVLSLAPTPLANGLVSARELEKEVDFFPLDLFLCKNCGHLQLVDIVDPGLLFDQYLYVSGTSPVFVNHFKKSAENAVKRFQVKPGSLVVDIGSNDGTLLQCFKDLGMRVLGVDPAQNLAKAASARGIPTLANFFSPELAAAIRAEHGPAAIITANNVFAHADDLASMARGVKELLAADGIFTFEVSYLADVHQKMLFDTIYHEHLSYHAANPLVPFFERLGLEMFDAEQVDTHGGSLRGYVQPAGGGQARSQNLERMIANETGLGLDRAETYRDFATRLDALKKDLGTLLSDLKAQGKKIVGFGAPAKATTLMFHFELSGDLLDFIVDDNPLKQGMYSPGHNIPILPSKALYERKPDYALILAWNFADSIIANHQAFRQQGGQFIVPIPKLEVR